MEIVAEEPIYPETMISPETGETSTRWCTAVRGRSPHDRRPARLLSTGTGDGVHVGNDLGVVDEALRSLKENVEGIPSPATIRRVRTKLKRSQRRAGALLFRVGENAFDKYQRGFVEPSAPTIQLIAMLDRHTELVDDLRSK